MNLALSFYNTGTGWLDRTSGSTLAIRDPGSSMLFGTEGRGYHRIDSRGYVNNTDVLADDYVIAVGSSFTQGKEVKDGERYTDLLNAWLGYTEEAFVYNVSQDGYYFSDIISGFSALLQEFPKADKIIIEMQSTYFTDEELAEALNQREYDEMQTGGKILSTLSWKDKAVMKIKEYSPLLYNVNNQISSVTQLKRAAGPAQPPAPDLRSYEENLEKIFEFITSVYDGPILILFHPEIRLEEDGHLTILREETDDVFRKVCSKYSVTLVDMSDRFSQVYEESHKLPYGFSNTSFLHGHFNTDGHRMAAEELIHFLEE